MARTKSSSTPHYELLYIVSNKYSEDELKPIIEGVDKIIKDSGGEITFKEEWGKKRFAYPIKHFNHGYYNLAEFDIQGGNVEKIDRAMRMSSEILRHMIVVKPFRTLEEIKEEKEKSEKLAKLLRKDSKKETEKKSPRKEEEVEKRVIEKTPEVKEAKKKMDLKDLDEKLDKILDTDDLL